ncbi:MAG: succinate dehydrogenase, partial [Sphingobacteriales bacterium 17-39-43]
MSNFAKTFSSSLGKKLVMALTGLFLCTFLIVHLVGNLQLFKDDAGQAFNA